MNVQVHSALAEPVDTIDITDCDREPIHLSSTIQPNGFLIAVSADWIVTHVSANAPHWAGSTTDQMLGMSLRDLFSGEALHTLGNCLTTLRVAGAAERAFGIVLFDDLRRFDIAVHVAGPFIIIECEMSADASDIASTTLIGTMTDRLRRTKGFIDLCRDAARQIKALSGFDRVMIYKFHPDGSGEVIAEALRSGMDTFMGLRFPASDVPKQARALYERTWLRIIGDVAAAPVPILSHGGHAGEPLDLSLSMLRAVSPVHIEYLRNMDVAASMSVSILRDGKLWGLVACHHSSPRNLSFARRTTTELLGQVFSLLLESRERDLDEAYEAHAREVHAQLMAAVATESKTLSNVSGLISVMTDLIPCDGVGVWLGEQATLQGSTLTLEEFHGLVRFLNRTVSNRVFATDEISKLYEPAALFSDRVSGMLAIPISRTPPDYVVFFRREITHSVTWAGDPNKPVMPGTSGKQLSPRQSFDAWREIVRDHATPWTTPELRVAESLRITLIEIILRLADMAEQERRSAGTQQKLLIAELNHRVRNILGLIQGLVARGQTDAPSVEAYASVLEGRVRALARAHDQITSHDWGPGALTELIAAEGAAYMTGHAMQIQASGPDVLLLPQGFSTLALVLHELMTNAAKYGALRVAEGIVHLTWALDIRDRLVISWQEVGGPPVQPPTRRGFGTTLIERSIPHDLNGETTISYLPGGVAVQMTIPAEYVTLGEKAAAPIVIPPSGPAGRLAGTVLLVEDNIIIALDAEEMLLELGATRVDIMSRVAEALELIATRRPAFAILDVNLGSEMSYPIATSLRALGVPFFFVTGYGEKIALPADCVGVPVVSKPYSIETLADAVGRASQA